MLLLQNLSYIHQDRSLLFENISLSLNRHEKAALIGNNGTGKTVLLKLMAGMLLPSAGSVFTSSAPWYVPQVYGQFNGFTIAQAMQVAEPLGALHAILNGHATEQNLALLNDDWTIEDRCAEALKHWGLAGLPLTQRMELLSGGQKMKVFLAGISIHQPEIVLLDEPSNHLDVAGRELLYHFVQSSGCTMLVVSHDRKLLNLLEPTYELSKGGLKLYGGNYEFYAERKQVESEALNNEVKNKERELKKAKVTEKEAAERKQKLDARGKKKQQKAGMPTIVLNTLRNKAEKSTARLKGVHAEKISEISENLLELRNELPARDGMKFGFDHSVLHKGKRLIDARNINFGYEREFLWKRPLTMEIVSGERIALMGSNGSGKSTLINIFLGKLEPQSGAIYRSAGKSVYIDQDYSLISDQSSVLEQAQQFNVNGLLEHEVKIRLNRFLFPKDSWDKRCSALSGGERMRLMLCCLTISQQAPDLIVLDEPTNNLDIKNLEILTAAINGYQGTLVVVSHDTVFLKEVGIARTIDLDQLPMDDE